MIIGPPPKFHGTRDILHESDWFQCRRSSAWAGGSDERPNPAGAPVPGHETARIRFTGGRCGSHAHAHAHRPSERRGSMSQGQPSRAQVVVVGGGVVGCATAYHLTRRGWTDVVVVERKSLTSGTTWHAAGLITQARGSEGLRRIVRQSLEVFRDLESQSGIGFQRTGTIHLAATAARWEELRRQADAVSVDGILTELLAPDQIVSHFPLLDPAGLVGGVLYPEDGRGNATDTTLAMANAARAAGAVFLEKTSVMEVIIRDGVVRGVRTEEGEIEAEYAVSYTHLRAHETDSYL